jgi:tRNA(Arg) A34 adenosine deaminase TadA
MKSTQATPAGAALRPLDYYWDRKVSELAKVEHTPISPEQAERHTILSLLVMALVADAWNGNKDGLVGSYPWRERQEMGHGFYSGSRYLGHNIACVAVDAQGKIIDFDFNHNDIFSSSAEHAEARLVRRIFGLAQIYDNWQMRDPAQQFDIPYATELSGVTIYTSLESCAQCSGIMTLGNVKSVVYLQTDPGQYLIGNILYNLSNSWTASHPKDQRASGTTGPVPPLKYGAPEPVDAEQFGFRYKNNLDEAYVKFAAKITAEPDRWYFWRSPDGKTTDASNSITSFLCTDIAMDIFSDAAKTLDGLKPKYAGYGTSLGKGASPPLTNEQLLDQVKRFRAYAAKSGHRGTPHR